MPRHDNIDVRVVCNAQPLVEYADPDNEVVEGVDKIVYVEATAGQNFKVRVKWLPGFNLRWASHLYSQTKIDGGSGYYDRKLTKELSHRKGVLTSGWTNTHGSFAVKSDDGQWRDAYFTFGALGLDDSAATTSLSPQQLSELGEIEVKVCRALQQPRAVPYFNPGTLPEVQDVVPEKMMKGRHIKNNTKYTVSSGETTAPPGQFYDYVPVAGNAGKVTTYLFRYRNRKILQHIGCIPRSPSPEPDHALVAARTEEMLKIAKDRERRANLEILRLREQLHGASRESSATIVAEDQETKPTIKSEVIVRGLKRERDDEDELQELEPPPKKLMLTIELDDEVAAREIAGPARKGKRDREEGDGELQEMAPPPKKRPVLIDLTDDD